VTSLPGQDGHGEQRAGNAGISGQNGHCLSRLPGSCASGAGKPDSTVHNDTIRPPAARKPHIRAGKTADPATPRRITASPPRNPRQSLVNGPIVVDYPLFSGVKIPQGDNPPRCCEPGGRTTACSARTGRLRRNAVLAGQTTGERDGWSPGPGCHKHAASALLLWALIPRSSIRQSVRLLTGRL
jgi:hypothetical protein